MFLVIALLDQVEQLERAIRRLRDFGIPEPLVVRARSAAAALSAEVPVFAGLRSLALGADEDRLLLLSLLPAPSAEEAERLIQARPAGDGRGRAPHGAAAWPCQ